MAHYGQPIPSEPAHDHDGKVVTRKRWTIQEIQAMPSWEYAKNLQNPDFAAAVDDFFKNPAELPTVPKP